MTKFESVEEVKNLRKELDNKFESEIPDYLLNYLDEQEEKLLQKEYFRQKAIEKKRIYAETTQEERRDFIKGKDKNFWKENSARLVKKPRTVGSHLEPVFEEPKKAVERVKQEEELSQDQLRAIIGVSEKNLYVYAIRYFPHYLTLPSSKLHKFLYKTFTRKLNKKRKRGFRLAVAAPRGNSKSSLVSNILPLWCVCYGKKKFIILISDTAKQAEEFLEDIKRELTTNEKIARDFPHVFGKGPVWKRGEITTKNDIKIIALGSGSAIRGRKYGNVRPDLAILDDVENDEMVRSAKEREYLRYQWFDKSVKHIEGPSDDMYLCDFLFVGTILGPESLLNAVLDPEQYPDWNSYKFKAVEKFSDSPLWDEWESIYKDRLNINREKDADEFFEKHKEEMLAGTQVLWPEGDPYYELMKEKAASESSFQSEKMNNPLDPTRILIPRDQLHFDNFRTHPQIVKILKLKSTVYTAAFDPSLGKNSTADYSCICTIAKDKKTGVLFVVDFDIKRRTVDKQIEDIIKNYEKFHHKRFGIETNAFQIVLADNLRKVARPLGILIPIEEIQNYTDKHMRLQSIVPLMKDGTIVFDSFKASHNRQYALAVDQITTYMEGAAHDDAFDSLAMAVEISKKLRFRMIAR